MGTENTFRKSCTLGILFLLPLITYGLGNGLVMSSVESAGHLSDVYNNRFQVMAGGILMFVNSVTVMFVGIIIYPLLARFNKTVALAYLGCRMLEAVVLAVGIVSLLSLIGIGEKYNNTVTPDVTHLETLFTLCTGIHFYAYQLAMLALGLGSVAFFRLLYKNMCVPPILSLLGITGYILLMVGALLELFGYGVGVMLSLPGGLFELIFGVWLIFVEPFKASKGI